MPYEVAATDFCRKFGQYQRQAQREPIKVHSHGQVTGYFVSPEMFEQIEQLVLASRRAYHPSELPDHIKQALAVAGMSGEHDHLNELMEDG